MRTALLMQGGLVLFAVALGYILGERFWLETEPSIIGMVYGVLLALPLIGLVLALDRVEWTRGPFDQLQRDFERLIELFRNCTVGDLFIVSLLAGVGEEALFRGVLQPFAAEHVHPWTAIIVVSVIFGLAHAISLAYVVGVIVIGVYLGAIQHYTGDLVIPMTVHAAYDFIALVYAVRIKRE